MSAKGVQVGRAINHVYLLREEKGTESVCLEDEAMVNIKEKAYRSGFEEGQKAGIRTGSSEVESQLRILQNVARELYMEKKELLRDGELEILDLSLAIAEKIMREEVTNKGKVKELVKETVERAMDGDSITIRLHPADLEEIKSIQGELISSEDGDKVLRLVGDSQVGRGGCLIETGSYNIDARLDRQLAEVRRAFGRVGV